mgnify:FL=1
MTVRPRDSWRQQSSRSSSGAARPATLSSPEWQQTQQALVDQPLSATRACSRSPPRPLQAAAPVRAHQPSALAETPKSAAARPPRTQARERKNARRRTTAGTHQSARTIVGTRWERRGPRMPWRSSLSRRALQCRQKGSHSMLPDGPPGAAFCLMSRAGRPGGASTRRLAAAAPRRHVQSRSAEIDPHQKQCLVRRYATFRNATSLPRMPG